MSTSLTAVRSRSRWHGTRGCYTPHRRHGRIGKWLEEVTAYTGGQEETGYIDSDSEYFNLINIARFKNLTLKEEYDTALYSDDLDYEVLKIIKEELY